MTTRLLFVLTIFLTAAAQLCRPTVARAGDMNCSELIGVGSTVTNIIRPMN